MVKHPTKMKNICLSLVGRSYSNGCPVNTQVQGSSIIDNRRDFAYIRKRSPAFVDKTQFIEDVVHYSYGGILLTAPHRFGKSVNLSMLKYFFEIEVNKETGEPITKADIQIEAVKDTYNYGLFRNLAIHRLEPEFMKKRLGRHPVILLDFSPVKTINNFKDAVDHCKSVTREAFKQHSYLINSTKLDDHEKQVCQKYCDDVEFRKYVNRNGHDIEKLKSFLYKHFGRKCVVLVDEYDAIFRASLVNTDGNTFDKIRCLYDGMIDRISFDYVSSGDRKTYIVILTGISHMAMYNTRDLDRLEWYKFLRHSNQNRSDKLFNFYGFSQQEFNFLMDKHQIPTDVRQRATEYYNGYCSLLEKKKLYNPFSVASFLDTNIIETYWSNLEFFEKHRFMLNFDELDLIIKQLIFGHTVKVTLMGRPQLCCIIETLRKRNDWNYSLIEYYTSCLYEQGCLQPVEYYKQDHFGNNEVLVKIANEEVRIMLIEELRMHYKTSDKFDWESMKICVELFDNIKFTNDEDRERDLSEIFSSLEKYCDAFFATKSKVPTDSFSFERYSRSLLYNIASLSKYKITTIRSEKYPKYKWKFEKTPIDIITPDIEMFSDRGCVMIKAKYDSTAREVLNELILHSCRNETAKYVLIGLNLSKLNRLSMAAEIGGNIYSFERDCCS